MIYLGDNPSISHDSINPMGILGIARLDSKTVKHRLAPFGPGGRRVLLAYSAEKIAYNKPILGYNCNQFGYVYYISRLTLSLYIVYNRDMRQLGPGLKLIAIILIIICGISFTGLALINRNQDDNIAYVKYDNIYYAFFKYTFKTHYETLILLWPDGGLVIITNYCNNQVRMPSNVLNDLNKKGLNLDNCILIIHNHWGLCRFSDEDKLAYRSFQAYGFNGKFAIWCHANEDLFYLD